MMRTEARQSDRFQRARAALRQAEAQWRPDPADARARRFPVPLGDRDIVEIPWAALHHVEGLPGDAAATDFALTIVRQGMKSHGRGKPLFWIAAPDSLDSGRLYPPALPADLAAQTIFVDAPRPREGFWALEEVLRSGQAAAAVAELPTPDTTAGRRLQLAAEDGGCLAVLLTLAPRRGVSAPPNPARSRWRVASRPDGTVIRLIRGQGLRPGDWRIDHARTPVSLHLAAAAGDGPLYPQAAA
ncbi:MAG: hypothetical protein R8L07_11515 [Alphaproteobacteria bacterium]|nr:hypothetical protein [Alphaproteobacteria bacterium]